MVRSPRGKEKVYWKMVYFLYFLLFFQTMNFTFFC